jgi:hypothetical protein
MSIKNQILIVVLICLHSISCKPRKTIVKNNFLNISDSLIHVLKLDSSNLSFKYYLSGYTINNDSINYSLIQEIEYNVYQHIRKLKSKKKYSIYKKFKQMDRVYFFYSKNDTDYAIIKHYYFPDFKTKQKFRLFLKNPYWGSYSSGLFSQNEIIYDISNKSVVSNTILFDISRFKENEKQYHKAYKKNKRCKKYNPKKSIIADSLIHFYHIDKDEPYIYGELETLMQTAIELNDSLYHNQIQRIERKIYGELLKDSAWSDGKLKKYFMSCDRIYFFYENKDTVFALIKYLRYATKSDRHNYRVINIFFEIELFEGMLSREGRVNSYLILYNLSLDKVEYKIKQDDSNYKRVKWKNYKYQ